MDRTVNRWGKIVMLGAAALALVISFLIISAVIVTRQTLTSYVSKNNKKFLLSTIYGHGGKKLLLLEKDIEIYDVKFIPESTSHSIQKEDLHRLIGIYFRLGMLLESAHVAAETSYLDMDSSRLHMFYMITDNGNRLGVGVDGRSRVALIAVYHPNSQSCSIGQQPFTYLHLSEFEQRGSCFLPQKCVIEYYEPISARESRRAYALEMKLKYSIK